MTLLALLRHGQTDWSRDKRIQGRTDTPLNDAGHAALAARALPERCRGMRVISSPLARCRQSAEALDLQIDTIEARLVEARWGRWEGRTLEELRGELGAAMQANEARGLDFRPEGGESPREVQNRVRPWLAEVAATGRPTLALTHRGVIRAILALALDWDMTGRAPVRLDWSAAQLFRLDAQGRPHAEELNLPLAARGSRGAD